ncbi:hypothetical protein XA68_12904 [Ophiocordyceps unilateralis]|uniref:Uncharacterized protein n=1 Tax=Ophiocordyceps unilateralis TaxID=268505 RepID=A0A2A9PCT9_OPHUN|nr:hypothetical protein XA68_12904 [Ophiocordyceps unilateralis]
MSLKTESSTEYSTRLNLDTMSESLSDKEAERVSRNETTASNNYTRSQFLVPSIEESGNSVTKIDTRAFGCGYTRYMLQMLELEPRREVRYRSDKKPKMNFKRKENCEAMLLYLTGEEADEPCERCKDGRGPFIGCVRIPGICLGACSNCVYNSSASYCCFHTSRRKVAAQAEVATAVTAQRSRKTRKHSVRKTIAIFRKKRELRGRVAARSCRNMNRRLLRTPSPSDFSDTPSRTEVAAEAPDLRAAASNPTVQSVAASDPPAPSAAATNPPVQSAAATNPPVQNVAATNPPVQNVAALNSPVQNVAATNPPVRIATMPADGPERRILLPVPAGVSAAELRRWGRVFLAVGNALVEAED